jgi:signal transduction histidine kinase/Flp pilus assembly protein TadD/CheY-like chemotaxis protein
MLLLMLGAAPAFAVAPAAERFAATIAATRAAMMANPAEAYARAGDAETIAKALPSGRDADLAAATAEWLQGEALARLSQPRRALPVLERALAIAVRVAPEEKLRGDILLSRGWVQETLGRIEPALRDFQQALTLFRHVGEARSQAKALQNIGGIYHDAGDNERSLRYYAEVADVYRGDPAISMAAYNNVGETLKTLGRYGEAEAEYRKALDAARELGSPLIEAHILTNLAATQLLRGQSGAAEATARRALALASAGDAADERPFIWGVLAQVAYRRGDLAQASALIGRTFAGVDLRHSALPYRDFHQLAASIYNATGHPDLAYTHLVAFKRLDDGVRALAASTNAALMAARFDFTNQNLRITRLQASRAVQDAALARSRARLRETVLVAVAVGGAIVTGLLLFGIVSLRRSRDKVRAANASLSEANVSLERALKVKSEFLAMTSHEIRTPLNGILGMTQVMLADGRVDQDMRGRIEVVHGAGETMRALVDDILDLAKVENGKLTVSLEPVDLDRLLRESACLWQGRADAKGLRFDLDLADAPARIAGDGARLRQIVGNLLSNAFKFTDAGSVCLAVTAPGDQLVIRVRDTGIGIAPDQQELIFEKFHQVDGGTTRQHGGTGLGLAICRSLADAMDGTVTVESGLGVGSAFTLCLPLRRLDPVVAPPAVVDAPVGHVLGGAALLLVEANPLTQRILAKTLRGAVGSLTTVANAGEARAAFADRRIDHLLLQADGSEDSDALAALIADANTAGAAVTILFVPGPAHTEESLRAMGAALAIPKPVAGPALLARLDALHGKDGCREIARDLAPAA